jgi:AhpD family alkylhydroperoxidase
MVARGTRTESSRGDPRAARAYAGTMARIDVPEGPGGEAVMIWTLRPEMAGMVDRMITTAYQRSKIPAAEREVARMRVAQMNDCSACATFRAPSMVEAGVPPEAYEHLDEYATYPGYTDRQRLAIEYAERFAVDHRAIDDELFTRLRAQFADDEILDLTLCLAVYVGLGRTLEVLQVDEACAVDL